MSKFTNPLKNIRIASPCSADWNEMVGNERQRFCGECRLNVYNLSGMTREEAENLILGAEGRLCVRFYKRADGSVLTKDCPVGWQALKRRLSKTAAAFASLVFGLLSSLGLMAAFDQPKDERLMGTMVRDGSNSNSQKFRAVPVMGNIAVPTPKTTPKPKEFEMGEIAAPTPKTTPKKDMKILIGRVMAQGN